MVRGREEKRYAREDSFLAKDGAISMIADCRVPIVIKDGQVWKPDAQKLSLELPEFSLDI